MSVPTSSHKVKKGETLTSIAKAHGFATKDQKKIFAARYNAKLRKQRTDSDAIEIGDIINFPVVTAAKLDDLTKKLHVWLDTLYFSSEETRKLKEAELADLKSDRDYYFTRVERILKRMDRGVNIEPEMRRAARDCKIWFELEKSLSISQAVKCGIIVSKVMAQKKEYHKKLKGMLNREWQAIKDVQKEIWALEMLLEKSIKAEQDAQSLLMAAIGIAKKLKASTF